jgi:hypothetical protein
MDECNNSLFFLEIREILELFLVFSLLFLLKLHSVMSTYKNNYFYI